MITILLGFQAKTGEKQSLTDVWRTLKENWDSEDILWVGFFIAITWLLYKLATLPLNRFQSNANKVIFFFAASAATIVAYYTFGRFEVEPEAPFSYICMASSFVVVAIGLFIYSGSNKDFAKITNGITTVSIGFGMIFSVIVDYFGIAYALLFGMSMAIFITRMFLSTNLFSKRIEEGEKEEENGNIWEE